MEGSYRLISLTVLLAASFTTGAKLTEDETVLVNYAEAVAGGMARLPCDITPPAKADRVHLVIWYKEGLPSPIYSVDARNGSVEAGKHWSEENSLGHRAFFQATEPAKLTIESVKDGDSGVYRCRVDFGKSPTRNSKVNLTVILPPEQLSVLDEKGDHIPHYVLGPYNEGATVDITCISTGGRPLPRVTWWQDSTLLDDSYEVISERRVRNVLRIAQLQRKHLLATFTCQASNNNHLPPITADVTLDMNLRPVWVKLLGENRPLSSENTYEISCEVVGARPQPLITWWKGSVQLRNTKERTSEDGNQTTSILSLVPTMEDAGKFLSCRADNSLIPDSGLEDGWKLNIYHVPIVSLELGSNLNGSWIREGVDVYFECNIKSNPWVYRVSWRHNGKTVTNNPNSGTILANQSLVLQSVSRARAGLYTCVASNQEGDGESNPLFLDIKFVPVCRPGQSNVIGVGKGEAARISCEVESNPPATEYIWKFNKTGDSVALSTNHYTAEPGHSVATYIPVTEHDFGTLLCWAKNSLGTMTQPCPYHIIPAGRPDSVINCSLINQTEVSLGVECSEGFDGGLPQHFVMEVYETSRHVLMANVSSISPQLTVHGLPPGLDLEVVIYAVNSKGKSDTTVIQTSTLKSPMKRTAMSPTMLQLVPLVSVLSGLVATLVVVAICVVFVLRCREKNKRNKETSKMSTVKQHSLNHSTDSLDNNPDIIPLSSEYQDPDGKALEKVTTSLYPTDVNIENCMKPLGEVTYAELSIAGKCQMTPVVYASNEPTVYAQIEPSNHHHLTHHTTLTTDDVNHGCASSTSRMGIITATRF
ncbi:neural cell adhesion molecule 2-like isoform X2 [Rhodnius prolixus]|uniref:neural cell adhesion molecule 2-like isoform X2 n=1 Tax=Rhodnius prolixus TaxID=13249 RepID=UPI003D1889F5